MKHNPNSYADVKQVLDAALAAGGGRYRLDTKGKASRWRHRAYTFRKILQELDLERKRELPGAVPTTPYDKMWLAIAKDDPCVVEIKPAQPSGQLTDANGNPISLASIPDDVQPDELDFEALELLRELGK